MDILILQNYKNRVLSRCPLYGVGATNSARRYEFYIRLIHNYCAQEIESCELHLFKIYWPTVDAILYFFENLMQVLYISDQIGTIQFKSPFPYQEICLYYMHEMYRIHLNKKIFCLLICCVSCNPEIRY